MDWNNFINAHVHPMQPYKPGMREEQVCEIAGTLDLVKVSSNESPFPPFESALSAGRDATNMLNRYPDGSNHDLKSVLAPHVNVSADNLVIGNGSNELLILLAYATLAAGDEVIYGWPSFIVYPMMCQLTGATPVQVGLDSAETYDLDAILAAITPATKMVLLCNPNNPTGTMYSHGAFSAFMDAVPRDVLVVVDEAYFEFVTDDSYPDSLEWFDGERALVVLRTFSKVYSMAGIRCGYGIMPKPLIDAMNKVRAPFNVNIVAQEMAKASLRDSGELAKRVADNDCQRSILEAAFVRLGIVYAPSQTNFVWIHTKTPQETFTLLLKEGVIVRDFGQAPALRVGIGSEVETTRIIKAFEKLSAQGAI